MIKNFYFISKKTYDSLHNGNITPNIAPWCRFVRVTLLSGLNNIPDEMNRICIAEDGEIRGEMAIFVIPGRFRNRSQITEQIRSAPQIE